MFPYLNLLPHKRIKNNLSIAYSWEIYPIQIHQPYGNEKVNTQTEKKVIKWKLIYWIIWNLSSTLSSWSHNTLYQAYIPFSSLLQQRYCIIIFWRSRMASKNSHLSKSSTVFGLTFSLLIHFESIFVYGVKKCSDFILLHEAVQFSQHHLLKRLSLPYCTFLPPLLEIMWPQMCGFISGLSILFH